MIFHSFRPLFTVLFLHLFIGGCISVNLSQEDLERADSVIFTPPESPFEEISSRASDRAWRNPKNGNTITYVSECGDLGKVNLKNIARTLLKAQNLEVASQSETTINGVKAIESKGFQKSEPETIAVELLTFKMDQCLFNLAFLGTEESLAADRAQFEKFKEKFKGP